MTTTYPLPTLAPTIDATGISAPPYSDILESLKASYRLTYGVDAVLDNDSKDGQWIAIQAKAQNDSNNATIATYNSFAPNTAVGVGLSSNVKINGLRREPATNSEVALIVTGGVGTTILNGKARDINGHVWLLPSSVTIPSGGSITVTAIAQDAGAILASPGDVTIIVNAQSGWRTVNNIVDATPGQPAEKDGVLRQRQSVSVAQPASARLAAILAEVKNVVGVVAAQIYENVTGSTDADGLPAHSFCVVVQGGGVVDVATAILIKKGEGVYPHGTTTQTVVDAVGITQTMRWIIPSALNIHVAVDLNALNGYTSDVGVKIQNALVDYINALPSGQPVYWARLFQPAQLITTAVNENGETVMVVDPDSATFKINSLLVSSTGSPGMSDIAVTIDKQPRGLLANMTITPH